MSTATQSSTQPQQPLFDTDDLIICTARYYIGRTAGLATTFATQLAFAWPQLSNYVQGILKRELQQAFEKDEWDRKARAEGKTARVRNWPLALGDDNTRQAWEAVRRAWEKEATTPTIKPEPAPQLDLFNTTAQQQPSTV